MTERQQVSLRGRIWNVFSSEKNRVYNARVAGLDLQRARD